MIALALILLLLALDMQNAGALRRRVLKPGDAILADPSRTMRDGRFRAGGVERADIVRL